MLTPYRESLPEFGGDDSDKIARSSLQIFEDENHACEQFFRKSVRQNQSTLSTNSYPFNKVQGGSLPVR